MTWLSDYHEGFAQNVKHSQLERHDHRKCNRKKKKAGFRKATWVNKNEEEQAQEGNLPVLIWWAVSSDSSIRVSESNRSQSSSPAPAVEAVVNASFPSSLSRRPTNSEVSSPPSSTGISEELITSEEQEDEEAEMIPTASIPWMPVPDRRESTRRKERHFRNKRIRDP